MTDEDYAPDVNDLQDCTAKRWEVCLDERLEYLPSVITLPQNDLWIEWYYIINLTLRLSKLAPGGTWLSMVYAHCQELKCGIKI